MSFYKIHDNELRELSTRITKETEIEDQILNANFGHICLYAPIIDDKTQLKALLDSICLFCHCKVSSHGCTSCGCEKIDSKILTCENIVSGVNLHYKKDGNLHSHLFDIYDIHTILNALSKDDSSATGGAFSSIFMILPASCRIDEKMTEKYKTIFRLNIKVAEARVAMHRYSGNEMKLLKDEIGLCEFEKFLAKGQSISIEQVGKMYKSAYMNLCREIAQFTHGNGAVGDAYQFPSLATFTSIRDIIDGCSRGGFKFGILNQACIGKRIRNCARGVCLPDARLKYGEIALPIDVLLGLTIKERIHIYNLHKMKTDSGIKRQLGGFIAVNRIEKGKITNTSTLCAMTLTERERLFDEITQSFSSRKCRFVGIRCLRVGDTVIVRRQPSHSEKNAQAAIITHVYDDKKCIFGVCDSFQASMCGDFDGDQIEINACNTSDYKSELDLHSPLYCAVDGNGQLQFECSQNTILAIYKLTSTMIAPKTDVLNLFKDVALSITSNCKVEFENNAESTAFIDCRIGKWVENAYTNDFKLTEDSLMESDWLSQSIARIDAMKTPCEMWMAVKCELLSICLPSTLCCDLGYHTGNIRIEKGRIITMDLPIMSKTDINALLYIIKSRCGIRACLNSHNLLKALGDEISSHLGVISCSPYDLFDTKESFLCSRPVSVCKANVRGGLYASCESGVKGGLGDVEKLISHVMNPVSYNSYLEQQRDAILSEIKGKKDVGIWGHIVHQMMSKMSSILVDYSGCVYFETADGKRQIVQSLYGRDGLDPKRLCNNGVCDIDHVWDLIKDTPVPAMIKGETNSLFFMRNFPNLRIRPEQKMELDRYPVELIRQALTLHYPDADFVSIQSFLWTLVEDTAKIVVLGHCNFIFDECLKKAEKHPFAHAMALSALVLNRYEYARVDAGTSVGGLAVETIMVYIQQNALDTKHGHGGDNSLLFKRLVVDMGSFPTKYTIAVRGDVRHIFPAVLVSEIAGKSQFYPTGDWILGSRHTALPIVDDIKYPTPRSNGLGYEIRFDGSRETEIFHKICKKLRKNYKQHPRISTTIETCLSKDGKRCYIVVHGIDTERGYHHPLQQIIGRFKDTDDIDGLVSDLLCLGLSKCDTYSVVNLILKGPCDVDRCASMVFSHLDARHGGEEGSGDGGGGGGGEKEMSQESFNDIFEKCSKVDSFLVFCQSYLRKLIKSSMRVLKKKPMSLCQRIEFTGEDTLFEFNNCERIDRKTNINFIARSMGMWYSKSIGRVAQHPAVSSIRCRDAPTIIESALGLFAGRDCLFDTLVDIFPKHTNKRHLDLLVDFLCLKGMQRSIRSSDEDDISPLQQVCREQAWRTINKCHPGASKSNVVDKSISSAILWNETPRIGTGVISNEYDIDKGGQALILSTRKANKRERADISTDSIY